MDKHLSTAGSRITCLRCTALSVRSKKQCGRPALKTSKSQKCQFHGGRSTGPKTVDGRRRIADAQMVHGRETSAMRRERSRGALRLAHLEDALRVLGLTKAPRSRGRKPKGYAPLQTIDDVCRFLLDMD